MDDFQAYIYTLKQSGQNGDLPKDPKFYVKPPDSYDTISTASDEDHRRLRRTQAHAFSEKAIMVQEQYLQQYTEQLMKCLRDQSSQNNGAVDLAKWVNFLTTDVIGDLSFGKSFRGLDTGKLHPWLDALFTTLKTFTFIREILRLPSPIINAALACIPQKMMDHQKEAVSFGAEAVRRRIAQETDRPDFMSYMIKHNNDGSKRQACSLISAALMSQTELEMAAITFIVAGSETTATMISGTIYLLLRNPTILSSLTQKIRSDFPAQSDLNIVNLQNHKYLNSVLKEGLRLYPPAPDTLFRTTKDRSVSVAGKIVPSFTSMTMNLWAAGQDLVNFHRPLKFIPERWMDDTLPEFQNDDKAVFKPFSVGPRDYIGKKQKIYSLWEKLPLNVRIAPRPDKGF
ncbi:isotrichodermin C-15 hydroxylase [Xylaria sp. FL1042]|nr:isotrichodermin C-15 hydroxylase [Xylaria sp. FL1042]